MLLRTLCSYDVPTATLMKILFGKDALLRHLLIQGKDILNLCPIRSLQISANPYCKTVSGCKI